MHVLTGHLVAIKSFNKKKINLDNSLKLNNNILENNLKKARILYETNILKKLNHKNIVQIYETFETFDYLLIIMEYISCGDLISYVRKRSKLPEIIAKYIFKQLIEGIEYIHSNNIVHRDIKLDNILIDINSNIKICDFGVSKVVDDKNLIYDKCGTPSYIAPEILNNNGYEPFPVDIWSAGVVLYTMLTGTLPFKANNIKDLHKLIIKGKYLSIEDYNKNCLSSFSCYSSLNNNNTIYKNSIKISNDAENLIKLMLEVDPKKRITISQILNHPWVKSLDNISFNKIKLFTDVEIKIFSNSKSDFRMLSKAKEIHENFTLKYLDTLNEKKNDNVNTQSCVLAPFNSTINIKTLKDLKRIFM